jgi:hypothetical protein
LLRTTAGAATDVLNSFIANERQFLAAIEKSQNALQAGRRVAVVTVSQ